MSNCNCPKFDVLVARVTTVKCTQGNSLHEGLFNSWKNCSRKTTESRISLFPFFIHARFTDHGLQIKTCFHDHVKTCNTLGSRARITDKKVSVVWMNICHQVTILSDTCVRNVVLSFYFLILMCNHSHGIQRTEIFVMLDDICIANKQDPLSMSLRKSSITFHG
jgi:hypothetical protein